MCVSSRQEVTAFHSQGVGLNGTDLINFAFIKERKSSSPQVDLHEWTLKDGEILQFSTKYISLTDFNEIKSRQTFTLLGATNESKRKNFSFSVLNQLLTAWVKLMFPSSSSIHNFQRTSKSSRGGRRSWRSGVRLAVPQRSLL